MQRFARKMRQIDLVQRGEAKLQRIGAERVIAGVFLATSPRLQKLTR